MTSRSGYRLARGKQSGGSLSLGISKACVERFGNREEVCVVQRHVGKEETCLIAAECILRPSPQGRPDAPVFCQMTACVCASRPWESEARSFRVDVLSDEGRTHNAGYRVCVARMSVGPSHRASGIKQRHRLISGDEPLSRGVWGCGAVQFTAVRFVPVPARCDGSRAGIWLGCQVQHLHELADNNG